MNLFKLALTALMLSCLISTQAWAQSQDDLDFSDIGDDFKLPTEESVIEYESSKRIFLIGKTIRGKFQIVHYNDEDLLGFAHPGIFPKDDDYGRTAGIVMRYRLSGDEGSLEANIENWLFAQQTGNPDIEDEQTILEETTIALRARILKTELKKTYLIIGAQFTNQSGKPVLMTYLQEMLHNSLSSSSDRHTIERDININYVNMILGMGRRFNLIKTKQVRLYATAEGEVHISSLGESESKLGLTIEAGIEIAGWQTTNNPLLVFRGYLHQDLYEDGTHERILGAELTLGLNTGRTGWRIEPGIAVAIFDTREDLQYEGGISNNTSIFIRFTKNTVFEKEEEESIFEDD